MAEQSYTLQTGQYYSLGTSSSIQTDDDSTIEIEIIQRTPGPQGRVTFAVWERVPHAIKATAQGSATVPITWLLVTLGAHRAELLTDGPARAEHLQSWLRFANSDGARWLADH